MGAIRTKAFRSGNSEAIRLPKEFAFGENVDLVIAKSGNVLTVYPAKITIADMVENLMKLPAPSFIEMRDEEPLPEREGL